MALCNDQGWGQLEYEEAGGRTVSSEQLNSPRASSNFQIEETSSRCHLSEGLDALKMWPDISPPHP